MPDPSINQEVCIADTQKLTVVLPGKRPNRKNSLECSLQTTLLDHKFVRRLVEAVADALAERSVWNTLPKERRRWNLHIGIAFAEGFRAELLHSDIERTITEQLPDFLGSGAVRLVMPLAIRNGFGWYLRLSPPDVAPPEMYLQVIKAHRTNDTVETIGGLTTTELTASAIAGNLPELTTEPPAPEIEEYLAAIASMDVSIRRSLRKNTSTAQKSLARLISTQQTFKATESGYRHSFQIVDAIHRSAAACRSVLSVSMRPVVLHRQLPPARNGRNQVVFSVLDYTDVSVVDSNLAILPELELSDDDLLTNRDCEGPFHIERQRRIEAFRCYLLKLRGQPGVTPERAGKLRSALNSQRRKLGLAFGYDDGGTAKKVILKVSRASFQLRETTQEGKNIFSSNQFPELHLIEEPFENFPL